MIKSILYKIWKLLLPFIYVFVLIHFAKDITQDILRIASPLDIFGDTKEDISFLPKSLQLFFYYGLGGFSFIIEAFLLVAIPKVMKTNKVTKLGKWVMAGVLYLLIFLGVCIILDPNIIVR